MSMFGSSCINDLELEALVWLLMNFFAYFVINIYPLPVITGEQLLFWLDRLWFCTTVHPSVHPLRTVLHCPTNNDQCPSVANAHNMLLLKLES